MHPDEAETDALQMSEGRALEVQRILATALRRDQATGSSLSPRSSLGTLETQVSVCLIISHMALKNMALKVCQALAGWSLVLLYRVVEYMLYATARRLQHCPGLLTPLAAWTASYTYRASSSSWLLCGCM